MYLMIRQLFVTLSQFIQKNLKRPMRILLVCFVFVFLGLLLDGSLFRLWRLQRDAIDLQERVQKLQAETRLIEKKIVQAKDPQFIELEARERFDLASDGDLVFVFSSEE